MRLSSLPWRGGSVFRPSACVQVINDFIRLLYLGDKRGNQKLKYKKNIHVRHLNTPLEKLHIKTHKTFLKVQIHVKIICKPEKLLDHQLDKLLELKLEDYIVYKSKLNNSFVSLYLWNDNGSRLPREQTGYVISAFKTSLAKLVDLRWVTFYRRKVNMFREKTHPGFCSIRALPHYRIATYNK